MIVKCKCPNCGHVIEINDEEFLANCKFCGVPFQPQEGIKAYNQYLSENNDVSIDSDTTNYAILGLQALKDDNPEKCGFYADDILRRNPSSPEGLLLRGFFAADNFSVEEGIRCYFTAYELSNNLELKNLIIETFKKGFDKYKIENFNYLFNQLPTKLDQNLIDVFLYALTFVSCSYLKGLDELKECHLSESFVKKLGINAISSIPIEDKIICYNNEIIYIMENNIITHFYLLKYILSEVDSYQKKKVKGIRYTFAFVNESDRVDEIYFNEKSEEFERILNEHHIKINLYQSGCYIATCVYGSYSYYKVNVLRRYRDHYLKKYLLGRLFIKFYYFISPKLVNIFQNNTFIKKKLRTILDSFVNKLIDKGFNDDIYHG